MHIRKVSEGDVEQLAALMGRLAKESSFMLYGSEEVPTPSSLSRRFAVAKQSECLWVAVIDTSYIGYIGLSLGTVKQNRSVGTIAIGVTSNSHGKGVGSALMSKVIEEARVLGLHRLQLQVQTTNQKAINLYKKFAFEVEGTLRKAVVIDGQFVDKFLMAKLL